MRNVQLSWAERNVPTFLAVGRGLRDGDVLICGIVEALARWAYVGILTYTIYTSLATNFPVLTPKQIWTIVFIVMVVWFRLGFPEPKSK